MKPISMNPKWLAPARYLSAKGRVKSLHEAAQIAERWPDSPEVAYCLKAETSPLTETNASAFIASGMARTVLDAVAANSLVSRYTPLMRPLPFQLSMPVELTGLSFGWVGENRPLPALAPTYAAAALEYFKMGVIVALSKNLFQPGRAAEQAVFDAFVRGAAAAQDLLFFDPAQAYSQTVQPASVTNGGIVRASSGSTAAQIISDLVYMAQAMIVAGSPMGAPRWVMKPTTAIYLASLYTAGGSRAFPDITVDGGTLLGIPVGVSANLQSLSLIALVDFSDIAFVDEGNMVIDRGESASVVMTSTPAASPAATSLVSLYQNNLVGLRAIREISWKRLHSYSAAYTVVSY